ncbi:transaldolase family protein [Comamonas sp. Z3]|uniref:transaldolase family protein n=1 Tax=Comamonas sp. Z3 TaxID=2601247 RepID=UPI0021077C1D|nr:transaldolase family protein [Comamonas sp. Z3]
MNATRSLHDLGQNPWFDNITRPLLDSGTLARYMRDFAVNGSMPNPKIFEQAIRHSEPFEEALRRVAHAGQSGEVLLFALVLKDLRRAVDLFRPALASAQDTATPADCSQAGGRACARRAPAARRRGRVHRLLAPCSITSRPRHPPSHR